MLQSVLAILPLFLLIGLGVIARHTVLDIRMLPALNQFVYYFAVPALLLNVARRQPLDSLFNAPALLAFCLGALVTAAVTVIVSRTWFGMKSVDELIMRALSTTFANYAYMGIPLTFGLLGERAHAPAISIILAGNLVIIGGVQLAVEMTRQHTLSIRQGWHILERSFLRSPIFLSTVFGLILSAWRVPLPAFIATTLDMLAPATIPVALFCLGATLMVQRLALVWSELVWLIGMKLLIHPALTWLAFWLLGIEDQAWLQTAVLLTALPTGALAHVIAMRYHTFEKGMSQAIVVSTLVSSLTVAIWAHGVL